MKINFKNFGCIKETEIELRPFTVIIGPNNSSKTYISYAVYGLVESARSNIYELAHINDGIKPVGEREWAIKVDRTLKLRWIQFLEEVAPQFRRSLKTFFQDSSGKLFSNTKMALSITEKDIDEALEILGKSGTSNPYFSHYSFKFTFDRATEVLTIRSSMPDDTQINKSVLNAMAPGNYEVQWIFSSVLIAAVMGQGFALPAERNALVLAYKILGNRRSKLIKAAQRRTAHDARESQRTSELLREQGEIPYPQPVEDFLDFLTDIELAVSEPHDATNRKEFLALAEKVEKDLQYKNKVSFKKTGHGGRELRVNVNRGLEIDLHNASSSIKQLAPFVLYLKHRATRYDLLLIDEPEMNLHPESQAKLLEILAALVNLGVKVILTTHSPYFMSHLNNLISGDPTSSDVRQKQAAFLYLKNPKAFLSPDQVSAYEMKEGVLRDLKDPDYGIRWDTLGDVSSDIQNKFFQIYEKGAK